MYDYNELDRINERAQLRIDRALAKRLHPELNSVKWWKIVTDITFKIIIIGLNLGAVEEVNFMVDTIMELHSMEVLKLKSWEAFAINWFQENATLETEEEEV